MIEKLAKLEDYIEANPREIGCIRIAEEEHSLAPAPLFVFGPTPDHLNNALFGGLKCNSVGCYVVRNGQLGYDAILFHNHTALWSLTLNHGDDYVRDTIARLKPQGYPLDLRFIKGSAACIHGPGYNVYGHWLVDILPRLHVLTSSGYDITKLRYILPFDCPAFGIELLQLIDIPAENIIPYNPHTEVVQFDELIIPTNLRTGSRLHSAFAGATRAWIRRIMPETPLLKQGSRLFISRENINSDRKLSNRGIIQDIAKSAGFNVVRPEELSLVNQILLFRNARQVVGEYGSALHSTIYGDKYLHCCALRGTSHWLGFIQSSLADAFQQTMSYVFGPAEPHAINYEFEIDPENFRRALGCLEVELALSPK